MNPVQLTGRRLGVQTDEGYTDFFFLSKSVQFTVSFISLQLEGIE